MAHSLASFNSRPPAPPLHRSTGRGSGSRLRSGIATGPSCPEARFTKQAHGFSSGPRLFRRGRGKGKPFPIDPKVNPPRCHCSCFPLRSSRQTRARRGRRPAFSSPARTPTTGSLNPPRPPGSRATGGAAARLPANAGPLSPPAPRACSSSNTADPTVGPQQR